MARSTRSTTPLSTRLRRWFLALLALLLIWLGGAFVYFDRVENLPHPGEQHTDAIVVLTGGAARLATALRLLDQDKADRLLISGVSPNASKASLLQAVLPAMPDAAQASGNWQGIDLQLLFDCCVDLDYEAANTEGNAVETADWVAQHEIRTIRLVTSNYHMPRSLAEFRRRLPGVTILPHAVRSETIRVEDWWRRQTAAVFLLGEYTKYVAALLRARFGALAGSAEDMPAAEARS